jgi:hypothetical protein
VEFDVPGDQAAIAALAHGAAVWSLCARGLSRRDPAGRPAAAEWVPVLTELVEQLEGRPATADIATAIEVASGPPLDVTVTPRPAPTWRAVPVSTPPRPATPLVPAQREPSVVRQQLAEVLRWWVTQHRRALSGLRLHATRAGGLRRLAFCAAMDLVVAALGLFFAALVVSPFLGI